MSLIVKFLDSLNESKAINLLLDNNEVFLMVGHSTYNLNYSQVLLLGKDIEFVIVDPLDIKLYNA